MEVPSTTKQEQNPELFIEALQKKCNNAINVQLRLNNGARSRELYRELLATKSHFKTDYWDGESLRKLQLLNARICLLEAIYALKDEDSQAAIKLHREAESIYSFMGVNEDDWARVENRYHWLHAVAANGGNFAARKKLYHDLDTLKSLEKINATLLLLFGKVYYFTFLVL